MNTRFLKSLGILIENEKNIDFQFQIQSIEVLFF